MKRRREQEARFEALLARALGDEPRAPADQCPDPGILAAFFEKSLAASEASQFVAHVSTCDACQERLAALARIATAAGQERPKLTHAWSVWKRQWWMSPASATAVAILALLVTFSVPRSPTWNRPQIGEPNKPPAPPTDENHASRRSSIELEDAQRLARMSQDLPSQADSRTPPAHADRPLASVPEHPAQGEVQRRETQSRSLLAPSGRPTVGAAPSLVPTPGARDPYRPFNLALRPKPVETPRTPLEQYDVGALKLVAVIYDTKNPKAMVEDDTGLGYTIGIGMKIGNKGGVVKSIDPDRVVVEEEFVDFYGEKKKSEIVLRLKPEGEKRP